MLHRRLRERVELLLDGVDEAAIIAHCRAQMAHFKAPKHVVHLPEGLPKTSTGKVQKFELRERARAM